MVPAGNFLDSATVKHVHALGSSTQLSWGKDFSATVRAHMALTVILTPPNFIIAYKGSVCCFTLKLLMGMRVGIVRYLGLGLKFYPDTTVM